MTCNYEAVLYINRSTPNRLAANRVMLCLRSAFIIDNQIDVRPDEFNKIICQSGSAGIVKL